MRIRFPFIGRREALLSRKRYWASNFSRSVCGTGFTPSLIFIAGRQWTLILPPSARRRTTSKVIPVGCFGRRKHATASTEITGMRCRVSPERWITKESLSLFSLSLPSAVTCTWVKVWLSARDGTGWKTSGPIERSMRRCRTGGRNETACI